MPRSPNSASRRSSTLAKRASTTGQTGVNSNLPGGPLHQA
jgi:hypothetical protein